MRAVLKPVFYLVSIACHEPPQLPPSRQKPCLMRGVINPYMYNTTTS